jgi:hypothetical protein
MPLRIYPLSPVQWERLAVTRYDACDRRFIDLVDLEAETDPGRRMRTEHARIQAYLDALASSAQPTSACDHRCARLPTRTISVGERRTMCSVLSSTACAYSAGTPATASRDHDR